MPLTPQRAAVLALAFALSSCGDSQQRQASAPPPPAPVTVVKPVLRTLVDQDEYVGRFIPVDSVEVRARVSGYLDKVNFTDGQIVNVGDLLFTIDKRLFQNTLDQARANLALAQSNLVFTKGDLDRGQQLVQAKTITDQVFDQRAQAYRNAQASVAANEALVRQAELDLQSTELRAPVTGRIGDRRVSPGNLVTGGAGGNTTLLATIVSIDPIRFEFTFDEASFLRYERLFSAGSGFSGRGVSTQIKLRLIDEPAFAHDGQMDFVDNVIDRSTGTIRGRAQLANPKGLFVPGMFARAQIPGSAPYQAVMVPDIAIASDQTRRYVLVADPEDTVRQKYVSLGQVVDGLRVIRDGITADDRVIVAGQMQARPGQKVTVRVQGPPPATAERASGTSSD